MSQLCSTCHIFRYNNNNNRRADVKTNANKESVEGSSTIHVLLEGKDSEVVCLHITDFLVSC